MGDAFDKTFWKYSMQFLAVVVVMIFMISVLSGLDFSLSQENKASGQTEVIKDR